jgi:hypothetical protein
MLRLAAATRIRAASGQFNVWLAQLAEEVNHTAEGNIVVPATVLWRGLRNSINYQTRAVSRHWF